MMRSHLKQILGLALLASLSTSMNGALPYFSIRSQGVDAARELVGLTHFINLMNKDSFYGVASLTVEGTKSFRPGRIFDSLFGSFADNCNSNCNTTCTTNNTCSTSCNDCDTDSNRCIGISGSRVAGRTATDWLADYFGLPTDFQSTVCFKPRVTNAIADFNLYFGLDGLMCGLWARVDVPFVHTKWDLNFCERVTAAGANGYDAGYFGSVAVPRTQLRYEFTEYITGGRGIYIQNLAESNQNVFVEPLKSSKFSKCSLTDNGIAEVRFDLGYNFAQTEDFHLGVAARVAAPTGRRPQGEWLFEPIVGNGHHWEFGGIVTSHWTFWRNACNDSSLGFYLDAKITHLFKTRQLRAFDLVGRPNSRYMLAERLDVPVTTLFANPLPGDVAGSVAPIAQFKNLITPVANLTTLDVKVSSGVQADIVALFNYTKCDFSFDIGYNFWGRSCERIRLACCEPSTEFATRNWALKGDANVYGFQRSGGLPVPLSATQSRATINSGTNTVPGVDFVAADRANPGIDNAQFARFTAGATGLTSNIDVSPTDLVQTRTSLDPVFLRNEDVDLVGARSRGLSSKIFAHLSYAWTDCHECFTPFLGIGGKVEFAHKRSGCCNNDSSCDTGACATDCLSTANVNTNFVSSNCCQTANLSEWGVWLKGGFAFDY
ncbi:hypothetical protein Noda2021_05890 [Candidatus Dependentiae bacterium Noda2021]|nr:hypothetical protein Noda2021_05890 [Candidatus Dependentiae bacterium Noda2021]